MNKYDELKEYNGQIYTGMLIGSSHNWNYPNGKWHETKLAPDKWEFKFESIKCRDRTAPNNTGASKGTTYHWYIIADQKATKLDNDSYQTLMNGVKFKIGHKRPHWRNFSYEYDEQLSYREKIIRVLGETLNELKREDKR
ncbi:MAG: hypothetical protein KAJ51_01860 [Thermoplasmata archaeon]|nr:hypothetical protein [Thermoplasmata archaeon]